MMAMIIRIIYNETIGFVFFPNESNSRSFFVLLFYKHMDSVQIK
jgi:hypothetical protein